MERRTFIEKSCTACMGVIALGVLSTLSTGCSSIPMVSATVDNNVMRISTDQLLGKEIMTIRSNKVDSDILLVKKQDGYTALRMMCTHQEQPLVATATNLQCPSHGSSFDLDGNVTREPAINPLKKYKTESTSEFLIVHLNQII